MVLRESDDRSAIGRRHVLRGMAAAGVAGTIGARSLPAGANCKPGTFRSEVIVLGGGMGGLAAAHELIQRGFQVTVIEANALGGKARSIAVPDTGAAGRRDLPGEHGFRFFPGFYHHVPDTMRRIPLPNGGVVHDNLIHASTTSFARAGRSDFLVYSDQPPPEEQNLDQLLRVLRGSAVAGGSIPPHEVAYFMKQFFMFMTSSEERRFGQWEHVNWWDFVAADSMSEEYQKMLAIGLTRNLVAAKAEMASTRTIGRIGEAFITNAVYKDESQGEGPPDQVLNGPTNEAWIDPWIDHLTNLGVRFQVGYRVEALGYTGGRITSARVRDTAGNSFEVEADWFVCAVPVERARELWTPDILTADPRLEGMDRLVVGWMNGIQYYLDRRLDVIRGHYSFVDSPWALTSLNQQQFWPDYELAGSGDGRVRDILSVDISNWDEPGVLYGKPARECTRAEIAQETWAQIKQHLNDEGSETIRDDALLSWYLDPAIVPGDPTTNAEPLLINTVGSWGDRPDATTEIPNLFLASDYVRTDIDLATMEAANEAGRAAANAIIAESGSSADPARMFHLFQHPELAPLRQADAARHRAGQPHIMETDNPPSLPWPLDELPSVDESLGTAAPITVRPIESFAPAAATADAPVAHRDDSGFDRDCPNRPTTPPDRPAPATGAVVNASAAGDGEALAATGGSLTSLLGIGAAAGAAAVLARRMGRGETGAEAKPTTPTGRTAAKP